MCMEWYDKFMQSIKKHFLFIVAYIYVYEMHQAAAAAKQRGQPKGTRIHNISESRIFFLFLFKITKKKQK